jgi:hypothetical protein
MKRIGNELDSVHFSLKKASQLVKEIGRQVCYLSLLHDIDGSGSSAFVEQMQRTDRSKPFVLDRAAEMGRNAQHGSKCCSRYCSKFMVL